MRLLLTGGGTAGHINPAIAIADIVKSREPGAEIAFVGTPDGMEARLVKEAGYPMYTVRVQGFRRSFSPANIKAAWLAITSQGEAKRILEGYKPSLVIGTGGYVSWPLLRAAARMGIPTALHESNAIPGLATRRLSPYMDALWLNFRETAAELPARCVSPTQTGNPLRGSFTTVSRQAARRTLGLTEQDFLLLSFGGSRGAEMLNDAMLRFMREEVDATTNLYHVHATGEKHFDACLQRLGGQVNRRATLLPYISKMDTYLKAADIVVCRAGAMTLSELALCGKCAILVPSPYVAKDHQRKNAALFASRGAACVIEEVDLPSNKLRNLIFELKNDAKRRSGLQKSIKKMAIPNANDIIYREIQLLAKKTSADDNC
jgi:UDP-N-acetylglucosamine--N-acetylmuramyl-(pentapeptide) pyrophosphoryl-undecaprenol N-acetylglucosamine transferase